MLNIQNIKDAILEIKDFPKNGINFKDWTPILKKPKLFKKTISELAKICREFKPDLIVAPESRGFWLGVPLAMKLKIGFVPIRKAGKLPRKTISKAFQLEYGIDKLEFHIEDIKPGQRVLIIDDVLATGGTCRAVVDLINQVNANPVACVFLVEIKDLDAEKIINIPCKSLIKY